MALGRGILPGRRGLPTSAMLAEALHSGLATSTDEFIGDAVGGLLSQRPGLAPEDDAGTFRDDIVVAGGIAGLGNFREASRPASVMRTGPPMP